MNKLFVEAVGASREKTEETILRTHASPALFCATSIGLCINRASRTNPVRPTEG